MERDLTERISTRIISSYLLKKISMPLDTFLNRCFRAPALRRLKIFLDKVSLGRAAELCQTPLAAFMDFAAKHGVPPLRYSFEDLEEERQTADGLDRRS